MLNLGRRAASEEYPRGQVQVALRHSTVQRLVAPHSGMARIFTTVLSYLHPGSLGMVDEDLTRVAAQMAHRQ